MDEVGGRLRLPGRHSGVAAGHRARDGGAKTFALTTTTKITVDQKPMTAADLKAGQRTRITSADGKSASGIYIRTHPPSGGGYPGTGAAAGL